MATVAMKNLHKSFQLQDGRKLLVLNGLTCEAEDGEFVCLLGPSGCGKSTTLDLLAGLTERDEGKILINGRPDFQGCTFAFVFQKPRLLNWKTVRENVYFALQAHGVPRGQWRERADRYLRLVGLEQFADEYPPTLSGGMQQRTALARALAIEPDVLLMDEPFSSLDELTARTMRLELLRIWRQERKTVFFVTHNALEALFLADKVYLLSPRPASVVRTVMVSVPRPREMEDPELARIHKGVIATLVGRGEP